MSVLAELAPKRGFHPSLRVVVDPAPAPFPLCSLYALISVPPAFILDRFQLARLHSEGKLGLAGGVVDVVGEGDLEGGVWKAERAAALIQLVSNGSTTALDRIELTVPLHTRYQKPAKAKSERTSRVSVAMNQPRAFWACPRERETPASCPPSALSSEFEFPSLANSTLVFIDELASRSAGCDTPPPVGDSVKLSIDLPTGHEAHARFVGPVTVSVVWLGFCYLAWTAWTVTRRRAKTPSSRRAETAKEE